MEFFLLSKSTYYYILFLIIIGAGWFIKVSHPFKPDEVNKASNHIVSSFLLMTINLLLIIKEVKLGFYVNLFINLNVVFSIFYWLLNMNFKRNIDKKQYGAILILLISFIGISIIKNIK